MPLDPRTVEAMQELYKDKVCHVCGQQAVRQIGRGDRVKFVCHEHFQETLRKRPVEVNTAKEHH